MCGIWGIIYKEPHELNKIVFNSLGVHNDLRGGDSCGIFIDGKVEYGVQEKKYYSNFFSKSKILKKERLINIALGHCRKASVGAINEYTAQPVVIRDRGGRVQFVLIHNGTIHNYKELAEKYIPDVDITNFTDSQVMAAIFYKTGYDVLSEYIGGSVFVTVDYRGEKPLLRAFKGVSKQYSYSTSEEEERPFYYIKTPEAILFSSIPTFFKVFYPKSCIFTLQANKLCFYNRDENEFYIDRTIDRSKCYQTKTYSSYSSSYYGCGCGYGRSDDYSEGNKKSTSDNKSLSIPKGSSIPITSSPVYSSSYINWNDDQGVYIRNNQPVHGVFNVDWYGRIHTTASPDTHSFGFFRGNLLYHPGLFNYLSMIASKLACTSEELVDGIPELISFCSYNPIKDPDAEALYKNPHTFIESPDARNVQLYNGDIMLPFTCFKRIYRDGVLKTKEKVESLKETLRVYLLATEAQSQFRIESVLDTIYNVPNFDDYADC